METRPISSKSEFITSYDLLKALAVITMIIDHFGYYMFPEVLVLRAIGRISFPIWFFLIGYAQSTTISPRLVSGAIVLAVADGLIGLGVMPLNVLFTIMLIRLVRNRLMEWALAEEIRSMVIAFLMLIFMLPSFLVTEYGLQGLLVAMFGYVARRRDEDFAIPGNRLVLIYMVLVLASYYFQQVTFAFPVKELALMAMLAGTTTALLYVFRPAAYPDLTKCCPRFLVLMIQLMGRRTLEIYVGHLLLFKLWGIYFRPERFTLFDWQWSQFSF